MRGGVRLPKERIIALRKLNFLFGGVAGIFYARKTFGIPLLVQVRMIVIAARRSWKTKSEPAFFPVFSAKPSTDSEDLGCGKNTTHLIIQTSNNYSTLLRCLTSLKSAVEEYQLQLTVVNHNNRDHRVTHLLDLLRTEWPALKVMSYEGPFNWSKANNTAAKECKENCALVFMNDDMVVSDSAWLDGLLSGLRDKRVGVVGQLLVFEDGRVQHCGVQIGMGLAAGHPYRGFVPEEVPDLGKGGLRLAPAVTGALMAVRADVFREVGGFDERFAVGLNDIDFCLRISQIGLLVLVNWSTQVIHLESDTRGQVFSINEYKTACQETLLFLAKHDSKLMS